jgi:hypothetical protein
MVLRRATEALKQAVETAQQQPSFSGYPPEAPPRPLPRAEARPVEDQRPARPQTVRLTPASPRPIGTRRAEIVAALGSPAGVRQALVLQEILGPPKSLQGWEDE